jgi:hypothetical protein
MYVDTTVISVKYRHYSTLNGVVHGNGMEKFINLDEPE